MNEQTLKLTQDWDKTFPKSEKVDHKKVTFRNRYGITLAADMYTPQNAVGKLAAVAVCGPFGAVKEQCCGDRYPCQSHCGSYNVRYGKSECKRIL